MTSPPIERGVVVVQNGRIVDLHSGDDPNAVDLGNVALLPGLMNAHTHLEFSDLATPVLPSSPFTDWIRALVRERRGSRRPVRERIAQGVNESRAAAVVGVGEIATDAAAWEELTASGLSGVVFRELLGLLPERAAEQSAIAESHLKNAFRPATADPPASQPRWIAGLSPHAPYSVHPDLFHQLVNLARSEQAPLAMHLAETEAELELLRHGRGPFVAMLQEFNVYRPGLLPVGLRPMDYLRALATARTALVVHGNYLDAEELSFLIAHPPLTLVYCPRTHAWFGHASHPWKQVMQHGGRVALGTDSRGSNPDLSLWREVQFLHRHSPEVAPSVLLELATLSGARALGLESDFGSLTIGKQAALACLGLPERDGDPWSLLLESRSGPEPLALAKLAEFDGSETLSSR